MSSQLSANRLSFVLAALFSSAPAISADLMQVYREAQSNDQQYLAARAAADAGREKGPQGLAGLLPSINASANTLWNENRYDATSQQRIIDKSFNTHGYNVTLTQPCSVGGILSNTAKGNFRLCKRKPTLPRRHKTSFCEWRKPISTCFMRAKT